MRSHGPASLPRLSERQLTVLEQELVKGPIWYGWPDQRWTLTRMKTVIGRRFHLTYTLQGVRKLLIRNGYSCQVPARCALERNQAAVTGWVKETWPNVEDPRRRSAPGSSSKTRPARR
ncbi:hypothetical protein GCM10017600_48400 [Streptosporangium carneum]|uniref:Winged helix-turn helix domain-containing protein n=1 Tax=Streptosporangium carneum TaxID=47481 RepID=A0A9W6I4B3_9ACTN|nr:hypothetical protein GCM10017600_48400 [Streptosporangium carneum]